MGDKIPDSFYWSATTDANAAGDAWGVGFINGGVGTAGKADGALVWCVRGGQGIDGAGQGTGGAL